MPGPLDGVRVLEFATMVSGPMATKFLADQGADVIKIETPGMGDIMRYLGPAHAGISAFFAVVNRNKRSITLNLKDKAAIDIVIELIKSADVLVQNFRPGAMGRVGLSYDDVSRINDNLIYASVYGFGADGPYAQRRVYDNVIQAHAGVAATQTNPKTGKPDVVRTILCDKLTAQQTAQAISSALFARAMGRAKGQHVEVSMLDASIEFIWPDGMWNQTLLDNPEPAGINFGDFYEMREAQDGFFTMGTISEDEFRGLMRAIGRPDLIEDPRFSSLQVRMQHITELTEILDPVLKTTPVRELVETLAEEGVPCGLFNGRDEVAEDAQVIHNESLLRTRHPEAGIIQEPRHAPRFSATPAEYRRLVPGLGEHTGDILRELGFDEEQITDFREKGATAPV